MHEGSLHSFNVAFQRELPGRFSLDVAYVGNRGHDVQTQYNENAATVVGLPGNNGRPLFLPFGKSADVNTWIGTRNAVRLAANEARSAFYGGLLVTTSYTLGRGWSYVDGDANSGILTPADFERSWSRTIRIAAQLRRELPLSAARRTGPPLAEGRSLSQVLGGWQISGIFSAQSGSPIAITMSAATLNAPGNTQRPDVNGTPTVLGAVALARSGSTRRCSRLRRRTRSEIRSATACSMGRRT